MLQFLCSCTDIIKVTITIYKCSISVAGAYLREENVFKDQEAWAFFTPD